MIGFSVGLSTDNVTWDSNIQWSLSGDSDFKEPGIGSYVGPNPNSTQSTETTYFMINDVSYWGNNQVGFLTAFVGAARADPQSMFYKGATSGTNFYEMPVVNAYHYVDQKYFAFVGVGTAVVGRAILVLVI